MELLWVWAYGLKVPLSILCALIIGGCFLNFLSARASGRGDSNFLTMLHIAIGFAIIWAGIYALPAPTYHIQTVEKIVYKDRPVIREVRHIAQIKTITRTVKYTQDSRFDWCMDRDTGNSGAEKMQWCVRWAKQYMEPRVVEKQVPVKVFAGQRLVYPTRDNRVSWCVDKQQGNVNDCTEWAISMEKPAQVQVRLVKDPFQKIFDSCNEKGTIPANDPNGTAIRNERLKICGDIALRASR